jgi:diguanylate cyclase (GGDEF)-like protein
MFVHRPRDKETDTVKANLLPAQTQPDPRQAVLAHTLSIMTAPSEDELVARTLAAARVVTHASVAVALSPDGTLVVDGDQTLGARIAETDTSDLWANAGGPTAALLAAGIPFALAARLDSTVIVIADDEPERCGPEAASLLPLVVAHALAARDRLRELDLLARRANSDPLTGLRHHRPFELRIASASADKTAIITLDVDRFKKINDQYGHKAGDDALVSLVDSLRATLRGDDQLYRIGGDEFAVVVDVNGLTEADAIARRLLEAARAVGHTISVGVALHLNGETGRETLARADRALYAAKRAGRDTARIAA